jgi:hypothetical protein
MPGVDNVSPDEGIDPCNRLKNEVTLETAVRVRVGDVGTVTC